MKFLARSCEKSLSPRSTRKIISFIELRIVSKKFVESVVVSSRTLSTRKESHGRSNGKTTRVEKKACCIIVEKTGWDRNRFQTMENVNAFSVYVKSLYERKKIFSTDFLFPLFLLSLPPPPPASPLRIAVLPPDRSSLSSLIVLYRFTIFLLAHLLSKRHENFYYR